MKALSQKSSHSGQGNTTTRQTFQSPTIQRVSVDSAEPKSLELEDEYFEATTQRKLQTKANKSSQVNQLKALTAVANHSPRVQKVAQLQAMANKNAVSRFGSPASTMAKGVIQGKFVGDPINHVYIDEETGDWYDVLGLWGNRYRLKRRKDGHEVWMDQTTREPMEESEQDRMKRLNLTTSVSGMQEFGSKMLSSGKKSEKEAYDTYSEYTPPSQLPKKDYDKYLDTLVDIDFDSRDMDVESHPQREDSHTNRYTTNRTLTKNPARRSTRELDQDFYRAESTKSVKNDSTYSRLTLRLNPLTATEVWKYISTQLVGNYGIKSAKIGGPGSINERTDSVIIYLNSNQQEQAQYIASLLASKFDASYFVSGVPFGMQELAKGIGWAERHPEHSSHGSARAAAMELALQMLERHRQRLALVGYNLNPQEAQGLLNHSFLPEAMRQWGIDPTAPHSNQSSDDYTFGKHEFD
ncbi:MAG: hypothetical protein HY774_15970 [Acidobacteria bacterium]|nr:hypothetical protein [Acidobacteriota bacterium]